MRLPLVLLALLLLLCALVALLAGVDELANSRGLVHPDHPSMMLGADGAQRHEPVLGLAWAFGALVIAVLVGLLLLGQQRGDGSIPGWRFIVSIGVVYVAVLTALILSYRAFATAAAPDIVLGFPRPTAWMLYGIYGVPLLFVAFYMRNFDHLIWSERDQQRFDRLVENARRDSDSKDDA